MTLSLSSILQLRTGITAVIGSGGKTSLLRALAAELSKNRRVILTTTTHILPFPGITTLLPGFSGQKTGPNQPLQEAACNTQLCFSPEQDSLSYPEAVSRFFKSSPGLPLCLGTPEEKSGKLTAPPAALSELAKLTDYLLVEADGSKRLPLKAHRKNEPVIPDSSGQVIQLVGLSGIGKPWREVCHCPELAVEKAHVSSVDTPVTAEALLRLLCDEQILYPVDRYLFNQWDCISPEIRERLERLAEKMLQKPVHFLSLKRFLSSCDAF